jgi:peptidoglycan/xylan/chitin deacetylase (PgdA/CDA1 family)
MTPQTLPLDSSPLPVNRLTGTVETEDNETVIFGAAGESRAGETAKPGIQGLVMSDRSWKRRWAARALDWSGGNWLLRNCPAWHGLIILNYHRIGFQATSDLDRNLWSATPDDFQRQLAFLKQNFDVIGLADLDDVLHRPRSRAVMITFDDGYCDNYTNAYASLKQIGLPATFFVTTGFLDQPQVPWWDDIAWMVRNSTVSALPQNEWFQTPVPLQAGQETAAINRLLRIYKSLEGRRTPQFVSYLAEALGTGRCPADFSRELWMTWDMVREMRANGMTIGGHSVTHPVLASVSPEQQDYEIAECRRRLVEELGEPIDAFSYPVGGWTSFNEITSNALQRHGYRWGFTYLGGYLKSGEFDRYSLRRTAIETDIDLPMFRTTLSLPQVFA